MWWGFSRGKRLLQERERERETLQLFPDRVRAIISNLWQFVVPHCSSLLCYGAKHFLKYLFHLSMFWAWTCVRVCVCVCVCACVRVCLYACVVHWRKDLNDKNLVLACFLFHFPPFPCALLILPFRFQFSYASKTSVSKPFFDSRYTYIVTKIFVGTLYR